MLKISKWNFGSRVRRKNEALRGEVWERWGWRVRGGGRTNAPAAF